jgi:hypothetical protein
MSINALLQHLPGGHALTNAKDRLLSKAAIAKIRKEIRPYGTLLDFKLDTVGKFVFVSVLLKGEQSPVEIRATKYELIRKDGHLFVEVDGKSIETSREWLTRLLQDKMGRHSFLVPEELAWIVVQTLA